MINNKLQDVIKGKVVFFLFQSNIYLPIKVTKENQYYIFWQKRDNLSTQNSYNQQRLHIIQWTISVSKSKPSIILLLTSNSSSNQALLNILENRFSITLLNTSTFDQYFVEITQAYLFESKDLNVYFQDTTELYQFLSNNIDKVTIASNGEIRLELKVYGFSKGKFVIIKTIKNEVQKCIILQKQNLHIQKQLKQKDRIIHTLIQSTKIFQQKISHLQENLQLTMKKLSILESYQNIGFHPHNSENADYMEQRKEKSIIITKVSQGKNHRFINAAQIFNNTVRSYKIRLINVPKGYLSVGFCDRQFFTASRCYFKNSHFASYGCDGYIHINADDEKIGVSSCQGQAIICTVDLRDNRNKVTWMKNNLLIAQKILHQGMRNRSLYFASITSIQGISYELEQNIIQ